MHVFEHSLLCHYDRLRLQNHAFIVHILNNCVIKLGNYDHLPIAPSLCQQFLSKLPKTSLIILHINSPNYPYPDSYN